jgi:outer membrane lipoprotein-sorting protein
MPVAVLSSLTLGLSIDFAIHFIQRSREIHRETNDFQETMRRTFETTGRAIFRNVLVLALGFVPMFFATLTPYFTVGLFFFLIMTISGGVTMILLPALAALRPGMFYPNSKAGGPKAAAATAALALGLLLSTFGPARAQDAQDVDAEEIMEASHLAYYYAGDDGKSKVTMTLVDKNGKERNREFIMLRLDVQEGGEQRYYTYFTAPSDVSRTTFMVIKKVPGDDDRWIYVPALDLVRRLSANDANSSFVGSDFTYEDVSGRHWLDDNHSFVGEGEIDGVPVWIIESTPKEKSNWSRRVSYIAQDSFLPLKEEYFDKKDVLFREFTADVIEVVDGIPTITVRTMKNLEKNQYTTVQFDSIEYNVGVGEDLFQERYLKNPPREYLD